VISLNLPRIALEAKGNEAAFWTLLDERAAGA
jgi:ribonucleoside-triphosphate reductase